MFFTVFPPFYAKERITQVTLNKGATVSKLLRSLWTKEQPWAIHSGCSWQKSDCSDSLFFTNELLFRSQKNEQIDWKTDEQIPNPGRNECRKSEW